ncbi:nucleoside phosphorylase [Actinocrispum wychmicini]|uniref:Uridine phosphorylase n=1 Tax=Actinocrispum wychmicini TaxID=1213861 RepID=A0A4R2ISK9_9PSEU|nr:nucleoside phosphorylase [Actinocrispum wychmicini]TCO47957.1 uridine phosphorylase [Actinocrispum wychmicini]
MPDRAWFLRCSADEVADRAVLVGDRGRVDKAATVLDDPVVLNQDRGLSAVTGRYCGRPVTVAAFGMGAPIAAVVLHELAQIGVRRFVRLGTVLGIGGTSLGDFVLAEGAVRNEATSGTYLPAGFPAIADHELNTALRGVLSAGTHPWTAGLIASYDGFYTEMFAAAPDRIEPTRQRMQDLARYGVKAVDMETSAVLVVARALGVAAASLCLASVDGVTQEKLGAGRGEAEVELLHTGLAALAGLDPV